MYKNCRLMFKINYCIIIYVHFFHKRPNMNKIPRDEDGCKFHINVVKL